MSEEQKEIEWVLQVFQYTDRDYAIGFVDLEQLNSSDYAFTLNYALAIEFDEDVGNYILYENIIVDPRMVYNLNKNKVISMFTPSQTMTEEYLNLYNQITQRNEDQPEAEIDNDDEDLNGFMQFGKIQ